MPQAMLYAHTDPEGRRDSQLLVDHLNAVADTASLFSARFNMKAWGRALGLLHDAGKSSTAFQRRLQGDPHSVDHATAGAKIAVECYNGKENGAIAGQLMAYAIAGHHGGQPNGIQATKGANTSRAPLKARLEKELEPYDSFFNLVNTGEITLPRPTEVGLPLIPTRKQASANTVAANCFSIYVLGRMLYSCLADADYLDTEHYMAPEVASQRESRQYASIPQLRALLAETLQSKASDDTPVNRARQAVLSDCLAAADKEPGLFSLTVPTGGGKTLSSLAFALKHAEAQGMDRVIFAIPFTSIVEQTAATLKGIFGAENVLEHHSNYDFSDFSEEDGPNAHRLATQNWDAPIIVTTNVQLLESLFACKPGKSRKIHNIAKSVVILDEAQTLPDNLLKPTLAMLEELTLGYGTSVVLCSATQPALDTLWPFGSQPQEIATHTESFPEAFGSRVVYRNLGTLDGEELAHRLAKEQQALCIVGTKNGARWLYEQVTQQLDEGEPLSSDTSWAEEGIFHLSAAMTPSHRSEMLAMIRERLKDGRRCIVVSTQLIEAGVDVDFPTVYRELAGIDSVVQAAGRCNREGSSHTGSVYVFEYTIDGAQQRTTSWLEAMKGISRMIIAENDGRVDDSLVEAFFRERHNTYAERLDEKEIFKALSSSNIVYDHLKTIPFEQVAADYRLIDQDTDAIFIPRGQEGEEALRQLLAAEYPAALAARLQQHCVSVFPGAVNSYRAAGALLEVDEVGPFFVLHPDRIADFYREDVGLLKPGEEECQLLFM